MDKNVKLIIAYDGTDYLGWQKTSAGPSIEANLQQVLEQILQHPIHLQAASRTDAGVHALGQVVNFFTSKNIDKLQASLNSILPKSIVIRKVEIVPELFHPTLDCVSKEYCYEICLGPYQLPCHRLYSWHVHAPLKLSDVHAVAQHFLGTHDFAAFTNVKKNEPYENTVRTLEAFIIEEQDKRLKLTLRAPNFLYRMARNLVGTAIDAGLGKLDPVSIPAILASCDRTCAGVTAPAHGLTLKTVSFLP